MYIINSTLYRNFRLNLQSIYICSHALFWEGSFIEFIWTSNWAGSRKTLVTALWKHISTDPRRPFSYPPHLFLFFLLKTQTLCGTEVNSHTHKVYVPNKMQNAFQAATNQLISPGTRQTSLCIHSPVAPLHWVQAETAPSTAPEGGTGPACSSPHGSDGPGRRGQARVAPQASRGRTPRLTHPATARLLGRYKTQREENTEHIKQPQQVSLTTARRGEHPRPAAFQKVPPTASSCSLRLPHWKHWAQPKLVSSHHTQHRQPGNTGDHLVTTTIPSAFVPRRGKGSREPLSCPTPTSSL